jgi:hypothetical protein
MEEKKEENRKHGSLLQADAMKQLFESHEIIPPVGNRDSCLVLRDS